MLIQKYFRTIAAANDMDTINRSDRIAVTLFCLGHGLCQEYVYKYRAQLCAFVGLNNTSSNLT
jgi:hypothetical protein